MRQYRYRMVLSFVVRTRIVSASLLAFGASCGDDAAATARPACIPAIEIAHAKVVRVEKNGAIVLDDGRAARLEGIILPAGASDHAPQMFSDQALAALRDLTAGHRADLAAGPPKEDRYGRIRAQIFVQEEGSPENWLQRELLRKGLARVAIAPDRPECAEDLYDVEAGARREKTGLWSDAAYAVRTPSDTSTEVDTFQIVEATVVSVSRSAGRVFLDFGPDRHSGFVATISPDDLRRFREIGVDPSAYANQTIRLRGWVERIRSRPEIEIATPRQIEVVDTFQPRR